VNYETDKQASILAESQPEFVTDSFKTRSGTGRNNAY
jgi:hypothetical protein